MKQLTQKLKTGKMNIIDAPHPSLQQGQILVKTHFSVVSSGTEGSTVKTARKGYIGKAKERPQQLQQVLETLKSQGPVQTYRSVMKKLDAYSPLGYSCAGEVIEVADDVTGFQIGDFVACGGKTASHAEVITAPSKLCIKLQKDTNLRHAAYNTLGAIALQGVRQADLRLGETCAVIGLGLIGQLTALLLRVSGVKVIGIDIDPFMVSVGKENCLDLALNRNDIGIENHILEYTNGNGCDAVIITAASTSLDPINLSGAISRKKGRIVIVGSVPTGFDREPHFYQKELEIRMSCSYGPGRYDPKYEEKGVDYPISHVRWTENRNMAAFQELIFSKTVDLGYLTTHCFDLAEAPEAYEMMLEKSEPFIGILIKYDISKKIEQKKIIINSISPKSGSIGIGFIGAGSYAQSHLLPNLPKDTAISLLGVKTASGASSRSVAERFSFQFCTANDTDIIENEDINCIFVATRHDSHAQYVIDSLHSGKNVFVEKPLCLDASQLEEIQSIYESVSNNRNPSPALMVGYNRRFSPLTQIIKQKIGVGTMSMIYRVNAGNIPPDSWIQDTDIGGGRIIGEVCHFVDFLTYINGSLPISVYSAVMKEPSNLNDILTVTLTYENGSIGSISYFANGPKSLPKEYIEIYRNSTTAILSDFRELKIFGKSKPIKKKLLTQDKGQKEQINRFISALKTGAPAPIPVDEIFNSCRTCFAILESIRTRQAVSI